MADESFATARLRTPEKVGAIVVVLALIAACGGAILHFMDTLVALAQDVVYFGIECVGAVLLAYTLFTSWDAILLGIGLGLRKFRRMIVHEDPIGVLSEVIDRFTKKLGEIDDALVQQDAARKRQANAIAQAHAKSKLEMGMANAAKTVGKPDVEVAQHLTAADRWDKAADAIQPQLDNLDKMQTALESARDMCAAKVEDFKSQRDAEKIKLDATQAYRGTVSRFKAFFGGDKDLELQDMALDDIERQTTEAEASVDQLMRMVNPMLAEADLKKQAETAAALQKFGAQFAATKAQAALPGPTVDGKVVNIDIAKERVGR